MHRLISGFYSMPFISMFIPAPTRYCLNYSDNLQHVLITSRTVHSNKYIYFNYTNTCYF